MTQPASQIPAPDRCGCCWRTHNEDGTPVMLGTLLVPARRRFWVCTECVNFMWHGRHPMNEAAIED